jgi:transcriptional regulator with XRE-family HTH domain
MAVLLREAIGGSLRRARTARRRTLRDVSRRARVSLGYLSEVERGRKEPSSELLAAICEALDVALPDVLTEAAQAMADALAEAALQTRRPVGLRHMDLRLAGAGAMTGADPLPAALPLAPTAPERPAAPITGVRVAA